MGNGLKRAVAAAKATRADNAQVGPKQFAENAKSSVVLTEGQANTLRSVLQFVSARQGPFADEADKCLALLPEPVDTDKAEAVQIVKDLQREGFMFANEWQAQDVALAAIKRGRELAARDA